jgi:cardiolipin synthase
LIIASDWAIRLVMLPIVPTRRSPDAAKGWLLLIFFLPWLGLVLYVLIGRPHLPRWRLERREAYLQWLRPIGMRLRSTPAWQPPAVAPEFAASVRLATELSSLPNVAGNEVELLSDYNDTLARIASDIAAAHTSAHLCFYIFGDDARTAPVIEALGRAAARGVECRVLIDARGSKASRTTLIAKLRAAGVEANIALPLRIGRKAARFDLRNHRKIVVIDGRIGYTGSQNMVASDFKPGLSYTELMVRLTGPSVLQLQAVFGGDWYVETGQFIGETAFPLLPSTGRFAVQVLPNGPSNPGLRVQRMVINLIYAARERVVMTTPYFIPGPALQEALETAAQRGCEVNLIVDHQVDQFLVGNAQRSYYEDLLRAGVRIHAYKAGFLHTKAVSIDHRMAWVGSSNMDMRSFQLNEEVVALFFDAEVAERLAAIEERYMQASERIELEAWLRRPFWRQVVENLTRLVSPLL